jgi:hypothetical protein
MARFADQLLQWPWAPPAWLAGSPRHLEDWRRGSAWFREAVAEHPVVAADNVCEYFFAGTPQEQWDFARDFPCLAPRLENFFVEMARPPVIRSEVHGQLSAEHLPLRWGFFFSSTDREGAAETFAGREVAGDPVEGFLHPQTRWVTACVWAHSAGSGRVGGAAVTALLAVGPAGELLAKPHFIITGVDLLAPDGRREVIRGVQNLLMPALLTVSFLHCKNVAVTDHEPPEPTPRQRRHLEGRQPVRYKTLDIFPMKAVLRREGNAEVTGLRRALHICRGHFARYAEGRPLFGRAGLHGQFWIPQHVRGSKEAGEVRKGYRVHEPPGPGEEGAAPAK